MYPRKRNYYARQNKKSSRPTDRIVSMDEGTLAENTQGIIYTYTATDPCTATNFSLDITMADVWVLAYVPDGYSANLLTPGPNGNAYEPSKNILLIGIGETDHPVCSRYSRKLAQGDSIVLIAYMSASGAPTPIDIAYRYTLSFTTIH